MKIFIITLGICCSVLANPKFSSLPDCIHPKTRSYAYPQPAVKFSVTPVPVTYNSPAPVLYTGKLTHSTTFGGESGSEFKKTYAGPVTYRKGGSISYGGQQAVTPSTFEFKSLISPVVSKTINTTPKLATHSYLPPLIPSPAPQPIITTPPPLPKIVAYVAPAVKIEPYIAPAVKVTPYVAPTPKIVTYVPPAVQKFVAATPPVSSKYDCLTTPGYSLTKMVLTLPISDTATLNYTPGITYAVQNSPIYSSDFSSIYAKGAHSNQFISPKLDVYPDRSKGDVDYAAHSYKYSGSMVDAVSHQVVPKIKALTPYSTPSKSTVISSPHFTQYISAPAVHKVSPNITPTMSKIYASAVGGLSHAYSSRPYYDVSSPTKLAAQSQPASYYNMPSAVKQYHSAYTPPSAIPSITPQKILTPIVSIAPNYDHTFHVSPKHDSSGAVSHQYVSKKSTSISYGSSVAKIPTVTKMLEGHDLSQHGIGGYNNYRDTSVPSTRGPSFYSGFSKSYACGGFSSQYLSKHGKSPSTKVYSIRPISTNGAVSHQHISKPVSSSTHHTSLGGSLLKQVVVKPELTPVYDISAITKSYGSGYAKTLSSAVHANGALSHQYISAHTLSKTEGGTDYAKSVYGVSHTGDTVSNHFISRPATTKIESGTGYAKSLYGADHTSGTASQQYISAPALTKIDANVGYAKSLDDTGHAGRAVSHQTITRPTITKVKGVPEYAKSLYGANHESGTVFHYISAPALTKTYASAGYAKSVYDTSHKSGAVSHQFISRPTITKIEDGTGNAKSLDVADHGRGAIANSYISTPTLSKIHDDVGYTKSIYGASHASGGASHRFISRPTITKITADMAFAKTLYTDETSGTVSNDYGSTEHDKPFYNVGQLGGATSHQYISAPIVGKTSTIHAELPAMGKFSTFSSAAHSVFRGNSLLSKVSILPALNHLTTAHDYSDSPSESQHGVNLLSLPTVTAVYNETGYHKGFSAGFPKIPIGVGFRSAHIRGFSLASRPKFRTSGFGFAYGTPSVDLTHDGAYRYAPSVPALAAPFPKLSPAPSVAILKAVQEKHLEYYDHHPRYAFEYSINDQHTGDIKHQREERNGDIVKGEYSLAEPDGNTRLVKYYADWETGFHAELTNSRETHAKSLESFRKIL